MSTAIQRRRGTSVQHLTFTGLEGEVTVDTDKETAVIHDGSTAGGFTLLREDMANYDGSQINNLRSQAIDDNATNGVAQLIFTDAGILIGAATGGTQGANSLNAADLYINGSQVPGKSNNETITGDWTFAGTVTNVDSVNLNVTDNTLLINSGEGGAGITLGSAGLQVDRGSETDASLIFDEADDTWKLGLLGSEVAIASGGAMVVGDTSVVVTDTGVDGAITFTADATVEVVMDGGVLVGAAGTAQGTGTVNAVDFFDNDVNINTIYSPIASPTFTGVPAGPTAALSTNTTQLATTAYVQQELGAVSGTLSVGDTSITLTDTGVDGTITMVTDGATGFIIDNNQNVIVGTTELADAATDGFFYLPTTTTGLPTGVPTSYAGRVPMVYDDTNSALYVYNGSWQQAGAADGDGLAYAIAFS